MPKKVTKNSNLEQMRTVAFTVTVGAATIYGLMWAVIGLMGVDDTPTWVGNLETVLLGTTMIGGICMGILYAAYKVKK